MPLSEHEQRLLDEIERALYAEDPKFAASVRQTDLRRHLKRRLVRAAVLLGVGIVLLVVGAAARQPVVGVGGFVVMLGAALVIGRVVQRLSRREPVLPPEVPTLRGRRKPRRRDTERTGLMERIEERWKRRWEERD